MQRIVSEATNPPFLLVAGATPPAEADLDPLAMGPAGQEGGPAADNPFVLGYLFHDLQEDPEALLPEDPATVGHLTRLGITMHDESVGVRSSLIPSIYVYFGQFVNHDIFNPALEPTGLETNLADPELAPLALADLPRFANRRNPPLDLDSVYASSAARAGGGRMQLDILTPNGSRPPGTAADPRQDLPRQNRMAQIGDRRNDENLILAQLLVAFLHAHNRLVEEQDLTEIQAGRVLSEHYQWIILTDYLPRIADPQIVATTLRQPRFFGLPGQRFFLPLEFIMAAFRFGHAMVEEVYHYNSNFPQASLSELFALTSGGRLELTADESFENLPESWLIQWENFIGEQPNAARPIDTRLVEPLLALLPPAPRIRLAVLDLLRGYRFRMPTGQAVARAMGFTPLSPAEIEGSAAGPEQLAVLRETGFSARTPLWFYILAEAAHCRSVRRADHLGPVGSTLVAETLIGLVRRESLHRPSILSQPGWQPSLGSEPGQFKLPDLLRFAGVLT